MNQKHRSFLLFGHGLTNRLFKTILTGILVSAFTTIAYAGVSTGGLDDQEFLPPDQAFELKTRLIDANTVRAEWKIHDNYHLYRDKFKFVSKTDGIKIKPIDYPKGKIEEDEFLGKLEVYRGSIGINIPIERTGNADTLKMDITSQGCADQGVCYPPQTKTVSFNLPPKLSAAAATASESPAADTGFDPLKKLKELGSSLGLTDSGDDIIPVDEAFKFSAEVTGANTIRAHWDVADGVYLYQDKFKFALKDANGITLGQPVMPKGEKKVDEALGEMVVYHHDVTLNIPVTRTNLKPTDITLVVNYQGCAEAGFCYPPQTREMPLSLPAAMTGNVSKISPTPSSPPSTGISEDNGTKRSFLGNLLFAFGIGFLLTFTPCVLPMIPILVSAIVGQSGEKPSKMRSGSLAASYVLGTAVTYSIAGWLAGASGSQLQAYMQNAWGLGIVAGILVILALSMFGFYEIQMPAAIQSRLHMSSQNVKGGSMFGTFFLGIVSALIVGACVTPLLMLVLGIAIQSGDAVLGASMMFAMALGMGVVLVTVGVGAGHLLPKAGAWMDTVKYVFGVLLIGVAIYLLTPLLEVPILLLWGAFFIVVGVYMGATQAIPAGASKWRYLWKGIGTVLLVWGVLSLIGGMQGNRDVLQPIDLSSITLGGVQGGATTTATVEPHDLFTQIKSTDQLDAELARAKAAGKPVMLDFYATWCTDCRKLEKATFSQPGVQKLLSEKFVALQADVGDPQNPRTEAIKKRFGIYGPPAILFFDHNGQLRKDLNFYGFKNPEAFIAVLNKV
jgi:thiol:disulfide interchange protein DsbD